jgi:hypothetical protein
MLSARALELEVPRFGHACISQWPLRVDRHSGQRPGERLLPEAFHECCLVRLEGHFEGLYILDEAVTAYRDGRPMRRLPSALICT